MDLEARYELLEKIGAGSFATVFRARDSELGREVAVKQIHDQYRDNPEQLESYWQEAQLLASLHHPNIATIFDIYRDRGWLILELMQGDLAERMADRQMDLRGVRAVLTHCLRALAYLHERGIVHGDIKPSNLMIDSRRRIKIGDFGLARRVSNEDGSLLKGTTKYMAPETVSDEFGEVGRASDLYSLGFAAYELMCGPNFESLFPGLSAFGRNKQIAWMMWHAARDRRLPDIHRVLEGVPDDLAHVIQKLCEKDQSNRYKTADEALADLNVETKITKAEPTSDATEPTEVAPPQDRKRLYVVAGCFAVSVILSLLMLFMPGSGSSRPEEMSLRYGLVVEIYLEENKIKIQDLEEGLPSEVDVGKHPRIFLRNTQQFILLRELKPGDRVQIEEKLDDDGNPVIDLAVSRPVSNRGTIKRIDRSTSRLIIAIKQGKNRDDLSVRVPEGANIELNRRKVELRDLKLGDVVEIAHLHEAGSQGGRVVDTLSAKRLVEAAGFVEEFDKKNCELTVRFGQSSSGNTFCLPVAEDCELAFAGQDSDNASSMKPDSLKADDRIKFWHDTEFRRIIVTRDSRQVSGVINRIMTEKNQLVLQTSIGQRLTMKVDAGCDVTVSLESAQLIDLRPYDVVDVTYDESDDGRLKASSVDARRPVKTDRWAIVIGVESYNDKFLTPLHYAIANAFLFKETLIKRYACAEDRVATSIDETRDVMKQRITETLKNARKQTQIIVYVSAHAYVGKDERVYLAGKDFNFDRMPETGLSLDWLARQLDNCPAEDKILLLDTSHQGNGEDLKRQPSTASMLLQLEKPLQSTAAIASCNVRQRGLDWNDKQRGLFAHFLATGFSGPADGNRDLRITVTEIFNYLKTNMPKADVIGAKNQTPVLFAPK